MHMAISTIAWCFQHSQLHPLHPDSQEINEPFENCEHIGNEEIERMEETKKFDELMILINEQPISLKNVSSVYLENPVDCDKACWRPYELNELFNQFVGGTFKSVLHFNRAKLAGDWTIWYLTVASDLIGFSWLFELEHSMIFIWNTNIRIHNIWSNFWNEINSYLPLHTLPFLLEKFRYYLYDLNEFSFDSISNCIRKCWCFE